MDLATVDCVLILEGGGALRGAEAQGEPVVAALQGGQRERDPWFGLAAAGCMQVAPVFY